MFPLKNYYESFIKKEIVGMKKEAALKRLGNLLACPVISKDTKDSVHIRFFTCTMEMKPNMDRWLGTIALRIENGVVKESAISVPEDKKNL
ncbi:hypothetical protein BED47_00825 [Gottfriedia luciferensis]|uniref:Uncharacterized protein n=1 Tax=Gottfriedia luciferensis TaxID=178774 RepID=A0ABX2ZYN3_9BACI|nr:hypothetical protein [Gottfriedia luciferensis]ODG93745.1 hypothetical protein BED47_00825 [Gottfriedia luciferensis]